MSGGPEQEEACPLIKWAMKEFVVDVFQGRAMFHSEDHVRTSIFTNEAKIERHLKRQMH